MRIFNRRGAGSCGGGAGGALGGMMPLLLMAAVFFAASECNEENKEKEMAKLESLRLTCADNGGQRCKQSLCFGQIMDVGGTLGQTPDGGGGTEELVCCSLGCNIKPVTGTGETALATNSTQSTVGNSTSNATSSTTDAAQTLRYVGGDNSLSCAAQTFRECSSNEYCTDGQWQRAQDSGYCCSTTCIDRVSTTLTLSTGENVIVENIATGIIVWHGTTDPVIGGANALRPSETNGVYSFILVGIEHWFRVLENSGSALSVERVS